MFVSNLLVIRVWVFWMRDVEVNVLSIGVWDVSTFVVLVVVMLMSVSVSASSCISLMLVEWCSLSSGEYNETDAVIIGGDVSDEDCNCCVLISDDILV